MVKVAENDQQRAHGLMHRKSWGEIQGMIFVFPREEILRFWMKNTHLSLDIAFFDSQRQLLHWTHMKPQPEVRNEQQLPVYTSKYKAKYALELPVNWLNKNKLVDFPKAQFDWVTDSK